MRVNERDAEGRGQLARYMLRAPLSLEKMTYDSAPGTVIYRSKMQHGQRVMAHTRESCDRMSGC